jgi:hypothetical protein
MERRVDARFFDWKIKFCLCRNCDPISKNDFYEINKNRITRHSNRQRHCRHAVCLRKRRAERGVFTPLNGLRLSAALSGPRNRMKKSDIKRTSFRLLTQCSAGSNGYLFSAFRPGKYFNGSIACLSSGFEPARYQMFCAEILDLR